jgi:hypothetical protein
MNGLSVQAPRFRNLWAHVQDDNIPHPCFPWRVWHRLRSILPTATNVEGQCILSCPAQVIACSQPRSLIFGINHSVEQSDPSVTAGGPHTQERTSAPVLPLSVHNVTMYSADFYSQRPSERGYIVRTVPSNTGTCAAGMIVSLCSLFADHSSALICHLSVAKHIPEWYTQSAGPSIPSRGYTAVFTFADYSCWMFTWILAVITRSSCSPRSRRWFRIALSIQ